MRKRYKYEDYEAIWQYSQASGNDLLLLLALVKFRQDKGMYASKETLAVVMRCNVDTVDRSLKRLKALNELNWDKGSNYGKKANRYFILLPGLDLDPNNTPADSTAISSANSSLIPPQTRALSPRKFTPLNSKETELKLKEEITVFDASMLGVLHKVSIDVSGLSPLQVLDLLNTFASSHSCRSAYTDKIRLERWWAYLDKFSASQAKREDTNLEGKLADGNEG